MGQGRLADPPQRQRGQGDAELRRGEMGVEPVGGALERPGVEPPLVDQFGDPAAPHRDEGEFRRDEEAVGEDERDDRDEAERRRPETVRNRALPGPSRTADRTRGGRDA